MDVPTTAAGAIARSLVIQQALDIVSTSLYLYSNLNPYDGCAQNGSNWDYIVVGGGTSGCVVAARLAENKKYRVLLIEAGGDTGLLSFEPSLLNYVINSKPITWNFTAEKDKFYQKCHRDPRFTPAQGKVLGGTNAIDYVIASQGYCPDFDDWAQLTNESSWSCQNVIRLFKKVENFNDTQIRNSADSKYHGFNGKIVLTKDRSPVNDKYFTAFTRAGRTVVNDININTTEGVSGAVYYLSNGVAQITSAKYVTPLRSCANLVVLKNTTVIRILFNKQKRAIGVMAYCQDKKIRVFYVTGEVIVCAGVFNTPKLLQLSGIGTRQLLDALKIPKISVLPVGLNYFNHVATVVVANTVKTNCTLVPQNNNPDNYPSPTIIVRASGYRVVSFTLPLTPPTSILSFASYVYRFNNNIVDYWYQNTKGTETFFQLVEKNYPQSRGQVRIRSCDPLQPPLIDTQYYSKQIDIDNMVRYVKDWVKTLNKIGAKFVDPTSCDSFKKGSDDYWKCYIQCCVLYLTHHGGTAALGSVVDGRGRVMNVTGLRIADGSIMPSPPLGSTTFIVMMIGENVAEMIKQDNNIN